MRITRREKVFGPGRAVPLDRNAKARITAYARAWDRRYRQPGQRGGALGRAALDVLTALLWVFHNARSGCCFPSYDTIAAKAGCARSTVAEAIKALEFAGVLTWQNRLVRIRERCQDLFGHDGWRWRVIRTSNAYVLIDPQVAVPARFPCKSDYRTGPPNQELRPSLPAPAVDQDSPLERALRRLGGLLQPKAALNGVPPVRTEPRNHA
jgi:helix-turn-helix protein